MTTSKIPPISSRQRYEATHAMITRQIETVKTCFALSFNCLQDLILAGIAEGRLDDEDLEEFRAARQDIMSTFSLIVTYHNTGVMSNRIIQAKLARFITDSNVYHRAMREELVQR